ncbi:hypothetical protein [Ruminococcus albus]|uniref:DUF5626 domain-containing protein n=1 Tax=Ruminococcus albus (strain ATCC 27210 / DSM 20455 / JCM 14654 / NCDO 2250 / 7) TaxID=697329 RepID=E6UJM9_RUMA7|nr:hypothetical protein [Ruminococcus albus]ADU23875.1 hypothetical protein Rumal_3422 [Ruminococcus albus 7 = DSM 20455]
MIINKNVITTLILCFVILFADFAASVSSTIEASAYSGQISGAMEAFNDFAAKNKSKANKKTKIKSVKKVYKLVPKQSGQVYITDTVSFNYDGTKVFNVQVDQDCDGHSWGFRSWGWKISKYHDDGVEISSTYYITSGVSKFIAKIFGKNSPFALKAKRSAKYRLYKDGTIKQLKSSKTSLFF